MGPRAQHRQDAPAGLAQLRQQPGLDQGRFAAAGDPADHQELLLRRQLLQFFNRCRAAEEQLLVALIVGGQAFVGISLHIGQWIKGMFGMQEDEFPALILFQEDMIRFLGLAPASRRGVFRDPVADKAVELAAGDHPVAPFPHPGVSQPGQAFQQGFGEGRVFGGAIGFGLHQLLALAQGAGLQAGDILRFLIVGSGGDHLPGVVLAEAAQAVFGDALGHPRAGGAFFGGPAEGPGKAAVEHQQQVGAFQGAQRFVEALHRQERIHRIQPGVGGQQVALRAALGVISDAVTGEVEQHPVACPDVQFRDRHIQQLAQLRAVGIFQQGHRKFMGFLLQHPSQSAGVAHRGLQRRGVALLVVIIDPHNKGKAALEGELGSRFSFRHPVLQLNF